MDVPFSSYQLVARDWLSTLRLDKRAASFRTYLQKEIRGRTASEYYEFMKTFKYPLGHDAITTLTVGELKAVLERYPDNAPVLAEWEGILTPFRDGDYVEFDSLREEEMGWKTDPNEKCLILNVDQ